MKSNQITLLAIFAIIVLFPVSVYGEVSVNDGATYIENQYVGEPESVEQSPLDSLIDTLVDEIITITAPIIGVGFTSLVLWLRKKGIEITPGQEKLFKEMLTSRYKKLAKVSWKEFRENEAEFTEALKEGRIPKNLSNKLKKEGKEFAEELLKKKEFKDFSKNLAKGTVDKMLEGIRTDLKNENQKKLLDLLPKVASIAVAAAFKENQSLEDWGKEAMKNIKPLLVNSEALEKESILMIIIKSEINDRLQAQINSKA